jgi:hypothetical protein
MTVRTVTACLTEPVVMWTAPPPKSEAPPRHRNVRRGLPVLASGGGSVWGMVVTIRDRPLPNVSARVTAELDAHQLLQSTSTSAARPRVEGTR